VTSTWRVGREYVSKFENKIEAMEKKARWMRNEMEKKGFIFGILYEWRRSFVIAIKTKNPVFRRKTG
jgi:hypothetical protein